MSCHDIGVAKLTQDTAPAWEACQGSYRSIMILTHDPVMKVLHYLKQ